MVRAGLSRAAVVDLALAVVDEGGVGGFSSLTLAAVAGRVGVAVPSLYKHVGGLPDLRREVAVVAVRELTEVARRATAGRSGRDAVFALGRALRGYALSHPGRHAATQVPAGLDDPDGGELRAASEEAVAVIAAALSTARPDGRPLQGPELVHTVRGVRAALHGFVLLELGGGFGLPEDVEVSFERLLALLADGLDR